MATEIKTSSELASRIAVLEKRLEDFSTSSIKSELAALKRLEVDTLAEEMHDRAQLERRVRDETAELERAYDLTIANLEAYVESAEAVRALRPNWSRTWNQANKVGIDVPSRVADFSARASRHATVRSLFNRFTVLRTDW